MLTLPLVAASLMGGTLAAPTANQARAGGGIALSLSSRNYHHHQGLERRDTAAASNLTIYARVWKAAAIEVGTPPQTILVGVRADKTNYLSLYEGGGDPGAFVDSPKGLEYHPGNSSTFKTTTSQDVYVPAPYNLTGRVDSDVVSIGGVTLNDLPFYGTNDTTAVYSSLGVNQSGQISLGFDDDTNGDMGDPIWKRIVAQGGSPQAGVYFERSYLAFDDIMNPIKTGPTHQDNAGELMLGGVNSHYFQGDINYVDTMNGGVAGMVAVRLDGFKVNGEAVPPTNGTTVSWAKPSGDGNMTSEWTPKPLGDGNVTYDASVPGPVVLNIQGIVNPVGNETFYALHSKIPGARLAPNFFTNYQTPPPPLQFMYVPCDTNVTVTLTLNGTDYDLRPQDWIAQGPTSLDNNCTSMFVNAETLPPAIGISFLQSVYTVFQYDTKRVGFARLVDGLPTRNITENGTVTVDVPVPTPTGSSPAASSPSSAADSRHPASVASVLAALALTAVSLVV